jgi:hypothetical protein
MYEYMHVYECACRFHGSVRMCACARAHASVVWPSVQMCVCIDACASRHVRMPRCARTRASAAPSAFVCNHTLVYARTYGYTCVYGWLGMDRRASVYLFVCVYMFSDIYLPIIYLSCTHMYAYTNVCGFVRTRCAHRYRYVSVPRQMPRAHKDSIAIHSSIYTYMYMCIDIHLYLATCTSERHRDARVGVR